ncbi:MAG: NAD(+) diphosphatase [Rhodospirillales bacterium]
MPSRNRPAIPYTLNRLDRCPEDRRSPDFETRFLADPDLVVQVAYRSGHWGAVSPAGWAPQSARGAAARRLLAAGDEILILGHGADGPLAAVDLSHLNPDDPFLADLGGAAAFTDLRAVGASLDACVSEPLLLTRGLFHWHRHSRFCGTCGAETERRQGGFARACTNPDCGKEIFPRQDPAVIMLVVRRDPHRCLLARAPHFPEGMVSTLAGFVEIGETLEACVQREVKEEAGIEVGAVSYMASQPWPFPGSLMLGFRAEALSEQIRLDDEELAFAGWFTPADIRAFPSTGLALPRGDSIARWLIERWLDEVDGA